ncbi:MAG: DUF3179 domain-containing (seleno)protein [Chloroflexi bacterium]|nr:DUF3179 domain-containing (seleno)protein [Chloroflexota bacterium]
MVVADRNQPGKVHREKPVNREMPTTPVQDESLDDLDPGISEQLTKAKASRVHAETVRQKIASEIMAATKRLYQTLVEEGEQTLEQAKTLEAEAELKMLEAQRELQHAQNIRQESDSYRQKVINQTKEQSEEMLQQSQTIKAEAVAFREKLLFEIKQQAAQELDLAKSSRIEADAYRERVIAQTQRQADETINRALLTAEQEGKEIKQKHAIEAQRVLAQAELIKAAAEEQLQAQCLYAEAANLQSESREILDQARSQANQEKISSDASTKDFFRYERLIEPEPTTSWVEDSLDRAPLASADVYAHERTEPQSLAEQAPAIPLAAQDFSALLPANELVLGLESNQQRRAYPISAIALKKVINDTVGELDILVTFGPPSELGMMFNRNLAGRSLTFKAMPIPHNGIALIEDQETGTIWEALTGQAISGPLAGNKLERLTSEYSFWFAWYQMHPNTEVYQQG